MPKQIVCLILVITICFGFGIAVQAAPASSGTIGLSFGGQTSVLSGDTITGSVYSYDIGGADAFDLTFGYDPAAFSDIKVEPAAGVTVLASKLYDDELSLVFMADPQTADYSNLLSVILLAGPEETTGTISINSANAANKGESIQLAIANDNGTISITHDGVITDFDITTLSRAMIYFMYDKSNPNWAAAAKYDLDNDGVITINDFIKIANAILDSRRVSQLKFSADGKFKIMQMSDIQDYISSANRPIMDQRTVTLINAALEAEKPDLVVITGDHIYERGNMSAEDLKEYLRQMVAPFEEHQIPWMITYGNHDEDSVPALNAGWNKIQQLAYYRSFQYNVNRASMSGVQDYEPNGRNTICVGDMYTLIYDHEGKKPLYNVWGLDSNRYDLSGYRIGTYDWIRPDQIQWYTNTSKTLEAKYGEKINSLMFFHIPTPDWITMWDGGSRFGVIGERNETGGVAPLNSGLFAAVLARGDVKGMFVGHDHVNDYIGNYYGVYLGYDANVGYNPYGLSGAERDRMRGVRVFELDQNDLSKFETKMLYAHELGVNQ
jgi:3',5'-cyclic AMP phosphodiesterase CpdA